MGMKKTTVRFTVEGHSDPELTTELYGWPGMTRREIVDTLQNRYGGRRITIQEIHPRPQEGRKLKTRKW